MIASVGFTKGGKELYRGSVLLPIIGLMDGVRPNVCSVSINTRHANAHQQPVGDDGAKFSSFDGGAKETIKRNTAAFKKGNWVGSEFAAAGSQPTTVSHLLRKTLETSTSFGQALRTLSTAPQGGLSYLTIAGTKRGEGAIITRARRCAADVRTLFDYGDAAQRWALVQTNHDHWLVDPVPASDGGFGADRAGPAMSRMGLARPGLMMPRTPGEKVVPRTPRTPSDLCDCRGEMSVKRMWQIIGSLPNFSVLGKSMISAVMVPAAGSCEVRYQVGIGAGDEYKYLPRQIFLSILPPFRPTDMCPGAGTSGRMAAAETRSSAQESRRVHDGAGALPCAYARVYCMCVHGQLG